MRPKKKTLYDFSRIHLLYISITKSNLKLSLVEPNKKFMLFRSTLGTSGYRNDQCNSYIATREMSEKIGNKIKEIGLKCLGIYIRGVTRWKGVFIRGLLRCIKKDLVKTMFIRDITPLPFNGCSAQARARKRRRKKKKFQARRFRKEFVIKSRAFVKYNKKLKITTVANKISQ